MMEHSYKGYKIILLVTLQGNGLWACPYIVEREDYGQVPVPGTTQYPTWALG